MYRSSALVAILAAAVVVLGGCGGGSGVPADWHANTSIVGRWLLTEASFDDVPESNLDTMILQAEADGTLTTWNDDLDSEATGTIETKGNEIRITQATTASAAVFSTQADPGGVSGTFTLTQTQLTMVLDSGPSVASYVFIRLRPTPPTTLVGDWLGVASERDSVPEVLADAMVFSLTAAGQYSLEGKNSGSTEAGTAEVSYQDHIVTTVQTSSDEPERVGRIVGSTFTLANGILRVIDAGQSEEGITLAKKIGFVETALRDSWFETIDVSGGVQDPMDLEDEGYVLQVGAEAAALTWFDPEHPTGQVTTFDLTAYAGGHLLAHMTSGVLPAQVQAVSAAGLASLQVAPPEWVPMVYEIRSGRLWLGPYTLMAGETLDQQASVFERKDSVIPLALRGTWTQQSRTEDGVPVTPDGISVEIQGDGDYFVRDDQGTVMEQGDSESFGQVAFLTRSTLDEFFAAYWQAAGGQLQISYREDGKDIVETFTK